MITKFSQITEDSSHKWKIGLDCHGVIDSMPEFFSFLTNAVVNAGGEVHIITGGITRADKSILQKYNIKYTHFFSITDYHNDLGTPTSGKHPKYGFPMIDDVEWDKTKGDYCKRMGIDLHIDDTLAYNEFFSTPFCRLWSHNNHPKINKDDKYLD